MNFCLILAKFIPVSAAVGMWLPALLLYYVLSQQLFSSCKYKEVSFVSYFCSEMLTFLKLCLDFANQCIAFQPQKWAQKGELIYARSHSFGQVTLLEKLLGNLLLNLHLVSVGG